MFGSDFWWKRRQLSKQVKFKWRCKQIIINFLYWVGFLVTLGLVLFFYHLSKKTFQLNKEIFGFFQTLLLCFHSSKMITILTTTTIYKEFLLKDKVEIKPNNWLHHYFQKKLNLSKHIFWTCSNGDVIKSNSYCTTIFTNTDLMER